LTIITHQSATFEMKKKSRLARDSRRNRKNFKKKLATWKHSNIFLHKLTRSIVQREQILLHRLPDQHP